MRFSDDHLPDLGQRVVVEFTDGQKSVVGFVFGILHRYGGIGPLVFIDTTADSQDAMLQNAADLLKVGPAALLDYPND